MNRNEIRTFIKDLLMTWQVRDAGKLQNMYSKEVVGYMDDKIAHYDDIMARLQFSKDTFKEVTNDLLDMIIEGDKAVARIKQTMIRRDDGKPTVYHITAIYRVVNSQVVETWSSFYPNVNYLNNA